MASIGPDGGHDQRRRDPRQQKHDDNHGDFELGECGQDVKDILPIGSVGSYTPWSPLQAVVSISTALDRGSTSSLHLAELQFGRSRISI